VNKRALGRILAAAAAMPFALGCTSRGEEVSGAPRTGPPSEEVRGARRAGAPSGKGRGAKHAGPSRETTSDVANKLPVARGDVPSAMARAAARLAPPLDRTTPARGASPVTGAGAGTLVLYDETGEWGWLGELYAINVASLVSHFGRWTAKPVSHYSAGDISTYAGVVYVGSTFDEPLPTAFLDDVLAGTRPVVWIDDNIWQLAARSPSFATTFGFAPWVYDTAGVAEVDYKGAALTRYLPNGAGIMSYSSVTTAQVLAQAVHVAGGTKVPWAVRGNGLIYVGENPMSYVTSDDRYLAFCDLLFDAFASGTPERHRALVRIEDVNSTSDPASLRAIADFLASEGIPFSVATIPYYLDPLGAANDGEPQSIPLQDAHDVVNAIQHMVHKGGRVVMHGYTHQFDSTPNPYNGVTADDFEFYRAHIDAANFVVYDGPLAGDSRSWAAGRIAAGLAELEAAHLPRPTVFEFPHYAGSADDSLAVRDEFSTVYHRGLYFGGLLRGAPADYTHVIGVMYPYAGRDIFGFDVIPENLGSFEPEAMNNNPPRLVADILHTAHVNRVVRDGFASFYFHEYYGLPVLKQIVAGIKAEGYTFVASDAL